MKVCAMNLKFLTTNQTPSFFLHVSAYFPRQEVISAKRFQHRVNALYEYEVTWMDWRHGDVISLLKRKKQDRMTLKILPFGDGVNHFWHKTTSLILWDHWCWRHDATDKIKTAEFVSMATEGHVPQQYGGSSMAQMNNNIGFGYTQYNNRAVGVKQKKSLDLIMNSYFILIYRV